MCVLEGVSKGWVDELLSLLRDSEVRSLGLASRPLKSCRDSEGFNAVAQRIAEWFLRLRIAVQHGRSNCAPPASVR